MISRPANADAMRSDGRIMVVDLGPAEDRMMVLKIRSIREEILHFVEHAAAVPRFLAAERGELFEELPLLVRERGRDPHDGVHEVIAAAGAVDELHSLAPQTEDLIRLRSRR